MHISILIVIALLHFSVQAIAAAPEIDIDTMRKSLVRVLATVQAPDYQAPWNPGRISRGVGTGFLISGSRVLTNAHVVSNARFIRVDKDGDPQQYAANVSYIGHDCDLAILDIDDKRFFEDTRALDFGDIPQLHSVVTAFGYPIGGERMSVTRGVVSRIEFRIYSHSGLDAHLTVQIDAAINPGSSGGPVMQNGKVIGVAFQGYSGAVAQNTGYIIPTPVINRFLTDVEDGRYDGYVELGVTYMNLLNLGYRKFLGLPLGDNSGVVITHTLKAGSAGNLLFEDDVLLKIDGYPINADGHIDYDGEYVQMEEVVERKFHGDTVTFDIVRGSEEVSIDVPLKGAWPYSMLVNKYDEHPEFVLFAGLLFQPLSRNLLNAYNNKDLVLNYYYSNYVSDEIYLDRPQIVVLTSMLPDSINSYYGEFINAIVDQINGRRIRTIRDVATAFATKEDQYVIRVLNREKPIVIDYAYIDEAHQRIGDRYGVKMTQYIKPETGQ